MDSLLSYRHLLVFLVWHSVTSVGTCTCPMFQDVLVFLRQYPFGGYAIRLSRQMKYIVDKFKIQAILRFCTRHTVDLSVLPPDWKKTTPSWVTHLLNSDIIEHRSPFGDPVSFCIAGLIRIKEIFLSPQKQCFPYQWCFVVRRFWIH